MLQSKLIWTPEDHVNDQFQSEYGNWLDSKQWNYFITFTTMNDLSLLQARKMMMKYFFRIRKFRTRLYWIAEPFGTKKGYHIHSLLYTEREPKNVLVDQEKYYRRIWLEVNGLKRGFGNNDGVYFLHFDESKKASYYINKEIRSNCSDHDFVVSPCFKKERSMIPDIKS